MDKLQLWCKGFSAVTIISGVLLALLPSGKLTSSFKTLTAIILTVMFVSPLVDIKNTDLYALNIFDDKKLSEVSDEVNCNQYLFAERTVENEIDKLLNNSGLNISCDVIISDTDKNFLIEKIIINGKYDETEKSLIENKINELFKEKMNIEFYR